uniref:Gamma-glutamyl hydrolase n=1 Tax=Quercus lobata TaxID=97700 RepID=A0A7N2MCK7_QUELO
MREAEELRYGISPERFQENQNLSSFFKVLTTSTDEDNKVYVSTVHSHSYPVTAFQWHPEKNAFEWGLSMIPHSEEAVQVTQHVANFLVSLLSSGSSSSFFPLSHSLPLSSSAMAKGEKSKDVVVTALVPNAIDKGKQCLRAEAPSMLMIEAETKTSYVWCE